MKITYASSEGSQTVEKKILPYEELRKVNDQPAPPQPDLLAKGSVDLKPVFEEPKAAKHDPVNHPAHYTAGRIEVIEAIEDWKLPYHLGNVIKYVARAGRKDPKKEAEDLKKARWYLDRHIAKLEK